MTTHTVAPVVGQVGLGVFFVLAGVLRVDDAEQRAAWRDGAGPRGPVASLLVNVAALRLIFGGSVVLADPFLTGQTILPGVAVLVVGLLLVAPTIQTVWPLNEPEGLPMGTTGAGSQGATLTPHPTDVVTFLQNVALIGVLLALL